MYRHPLPSRGVVFTQANACLPQRVVFHCTSMTFGEFVFLSVLWYWLKDFLPPSQTSTIETTYICLLVRTFFFSRDSFGSSATLLLSDKFASINTIQRHNLRGAQHNLFIPRPNSEALKKSFRYRGAVTWNSLSAEAKQATTLNCFYSAIVH